MTAITATRANQDFFSVMDLVNKSNDDVMISNDDGTNYVLLSEKNWRSIMETAYLNSIPNMAESIIESSKTALEECSVYNPNEEW